MKHGEIARVVIRKAEQRRLDLETRLRQAAGGLLTEGILGGLARHVAQRSWVVAHGYQVAEEIEQGAVLESAQEGRTRLLVTFLGRTPVPPYGGFAADLYEETAPGEWTRLTGLADWRPSQWAGLREWWELVDPGVFGDFTIANEEDDADELQDGEDDDQWDDLEPGEDEA